MNRRMLLRTAAAASCVVAAPLAHARLPSGLRSAPGLVDTLARLSGAGVFYLWLVNSGMAERLDAMNQATVFVPVDGIWGAPHRIGQLDGLARRHLVRQHLCDALLEPGDALEQVARNLNAAEVRISGSSVNGVPIVRSGTRARNGLIHLIDGFIT